MRTRFFMGALGLALAALLAGCGVTAASNGCQTLANSAPTINQGVVTIATDHGAYATSNDIVATVTNNTGQPIFTYDHKASCTVLAIQQQVNGAWVAPSKTIAGCAEERPTGLVELVPGKAYTVTIHAGYLRSAPWPAGTYRLVLTYFTSRANVEQVGGTTVYSQPLTMMDCGGAPTATGGSSAAPKVTAQPAGTISVSPQTQH